MAAAGTQYTVFGFDSRLDWRPTVFVDGFPKTRVCSACYLVPSKTALLPCQHVLCNRCYDSHGDIKGNCCPLDKIVWKPEDVSWSTFTKDNLLCRQIQCWNWRNGCYVVGTLCEIVDHLDDCQYYAVSCFRCKQSMPYKELAGHLDTDNCPTKEANTARSSHGIADATITIFAQAIAEVRDKISSVQTSVHESKELISDHGQVVTERETADRLVPESLQTFDNSLKENMGHSQGQAGRTFKELSLIRKSISAIMDAVRDVETLVNKLNPSLATSSAEDLRNVSASCLNLEQKLDGFSAFLTKEFDKTGQSLKAFQCLEAPPSANSSAEDSSNVSAPCANLEQKLDGFSSFSTKEFQKTGHSLEALQCLEAPGSGDSSAQVSRNVSASCPYLEQKLDGFSTFSDKEFEKTGQSLEAFQSLEAPRSANSSAEDLGYVSASCPNLEQKLDAFFAFSTKEFGKTGQSLEALQFLEPPRSAKASAEVSRNVSAPCPYLERKLDGLSAFSTEEFGKTGQSFESLQCLEDPRSPNSSAKLSRDLSASCPNMVKKLDCFSAFSTEEFEKTGKSLEAPRSGSFIAEVTRNVSASCPYLEQKLDGFSAFSSKEFEQTGQTLEAFQCLEAVRSTISSAEDSRNVSASCPYLEQKLDGCSVFATEEFEKTGQSLEALQTTLKERANGEIVTRASLKRLHEGLNDAVCLNIVLGKAAESVSGLPLCVREPLIWSVEKWSIGVLD